MAADKWYEAGRVWEEDHGLLDEQQVTQCARAEWERRCDRRCRRE